MSERNLYEVTGDIKDINTLLVPRAQLEAMVGQQEPVAMLHDDGYWTPMKTEAGRALNDRLMRAGSISVDVYAAPVAQQPTFDARRALEAIEALLSNIRRDAPSLSGKVMGFAEEVAAALRDKVAQQPQAEPTDSMGIPLSCGKPLCSPGDHHPLCKLHKKPQAEALTDEQRLGWYAWRVKDLEEKLANAQKQPQAEPFGYVSQHTNGLWEFSPTTAGVYPDTAKSITAVYAKQPQAEVVEVHRCTGAGDTAFGSKADCQFCAAPQQAEAVPTDADLDSIIEKHLPSYWQYGAFEQDRLRALARTLTATKAAPQQAEAVPINYSPLYEFAGKNRVSYNELCAAVQAAIAQQKGQP